MISDGIANRTGYRARLFNSALEYGLRLLFLLDAATPGQADLQRLISYDYLLVHSGDIDGGPPSLHPAVPFRGSELLIKRDLVRAGLDLMFARELVEKRLTGDGIVYRGSELTRAFLNLLKTPYAVNVRARARWVIERFGPLTDEGLNSFMASSVGLWGAEFEHLAALQDLEL
jgi:ABC-three component (ABC-3C) system Middle Component 2